MTECACGSHSPYKECCGRYIDGGLAPTAEALMRSRYTAITLGELDHIEKTCPENALETFNRIDMERSLPGVESLGLECDKGADASVVDRDRIIQD